MKRIITLFLAFSMVFSLIGCSADSSQSSAADIPTSETINETTAAASEQSETADVIVVGGGLSGMMAAIELSRLQPDWDIVLLEKQSSLGGNLAYTGGVIMGFDETYSGSANHIVAAPSRFVQCFNNVLAAQTEYGIMEEGDFSVNEALITNVFQSYQETVDQFFEAGVPFPEAFETYGVNTYSDFYSIEAGEGYGETAIEFRDIMDRFTRSTAVDVRTCAEVTELLSENGKITGVTAQTAAGPVTIRSSAVILATGGIADNDDMMAQYNSNYAGIEMLSTGASTGSAITLTRPFGTPIVGDGLFGAFVSNDSTWEMLGSYFLVDSDGTRFVNEAATPYIQFIASHALKSGHAFMLCDADYAAAHPEEIALKLEEGDITEYDSLEALCQGEGISYENLIATIADYNQAVDQGINPQYDLPVELANKLEKAPFYAEKAADYCFETIPGLLVNERLQVLNSDCAVIEGLYACGEAIIGNIQTNLYAQAGNGLTWAGASGTSAARMAASDIRAASAEHVSSDVLVIGGGLAGVSAALDCAEAGLTVILIDKAGLLGGSSVRCDGMLLAGGTSLQAESGITDTADAFYDEMIQLHTENYVDSDMIYVYTHQSASVYDWMVEHGVEFEYVWADHLNTARSHAAAGGGSQMMGTLLSVLKSNENVTVYTDTRATRLLTAGGRIIGAQATQTNGTEILFYADNTVLATGGYACNRDLILQTSGNIMANYTTDSANNTGDGYLMAQAVGADIFNTVDCLAMDYYPIGTTYIGCWTYDLLFVTPDGERHFDESMYVTDRTSAILHMGYDHEYAILDEEDYQLYKDDINAGMEAGAAYKADSVEDLAQQLFIDPDTLAGTVSRYNGLCDAAKDSDFGKASEYMNKLEGDTFYAMKLEVNVTETYSGPRINTNAQVLDTNGEPIEGLYAAGAITLWQITDYHYSDCGSSILNSAVFGRQAAADIIAKSK